MRWLVFLPLRILSAVSRWGLVPTGLLILAGVALWWVFGR
jgi:hypothetical protein